VEIAVASDKVNTPDTDTAHPEVEIADDDITLDDSPPTITKHRASKDEWAKFKEEVRARSRLEDLIQVQWDKRSPTDWWCSSPLRPGHDSTPSFHINPERQVWKDFGLGDKGGDVFAFLGRLWGCSFIELLKRRAAELNMPLPSTTPLTVEE
jgi:CHC2 zinc finger